MHNITTNYKGVKRIELRPYDMSNEEWEMYIDSDFQLWKWKEWYYYSMNSTELIYVGDCIQDFLDFIMCEE